MTGMGVLMNDDPMDDAYRQVRGLPRAETDTTVVAAVSTSKTEQWLVLERKRRDLEAELKATVTQQDALRQDILGRWSMNGTSSEKIDGQTVHLQRKVYPKVSDKLALTAALRKEGLDDLLTVDDKAFAAYVTACDEDGEPLPSEVAEQVASQFERFSLVVKLK